jgi:chemotaxis protein methyltransferase CheR
MRAGKEERNTLALSAARLIPRPSCACSLDAPRAVRSIPRPSYASALEQPAAAFAPAEQIAPADYQRFADLIYQTCGIHMNASKRLMVETRLRKRLRATGLKTFREYWKRLHDPTDQGVELVGSCKEAYTLAMVLSECRERGEVGDFEILGTDISTEVLGKARRAVYEPEEIEPIPEALRKKYLLRRRGDGGGRFRIAPELRARVRFERLNFMDNGFRLEALFDIIFCRNVIIYFDRETQAKVVNKLVESLDPQGYFFTGHSETLSGFATQLVSVAPTIYRKGKKT